MAVRGGWKPQLHVYLTFCIYFQGQENFIFIKGKVREFGKVMSVATMSQCFLLSAVLHVNRRAEVDKIIFFAKRD